MDEENNCDGVKRKRPEEEETNNDNEDLELMGKSDREIADCVVRIKRNLQTIGVRLPDGGLKFKANLIRHQRAASSHGKHADFVRKKMEQDKHSRTVCAFEKDSPYINPCQGRKSNSKTPIPGKGRCRKTTSLANRKKKINQQQDGDSPTSFSKPTSPQDPPSRNLRRSSGRSYCLVDEEPVAQKFMLNLDLSVKDGKIYYPSRDDPNSVEVDHTHIACLAPEACISSIIMNYYI
ncbi:uncharacterized protein LOC143602301 [Bidens hawaiensis]|uniref:uncharacterized protein LOC143602301 n=1 Tax=Bidens hawaiensis TaxID=980011 RepID=UPI00404A6332